MTDPIKGKNPLARLDSLLNQPEREGLDQKIDEAVKLVLQEIKEKPFDKRDISRIVVLRDRISKLQADEKSSEKVSSVFITSFGKELKNEIQKFITSTYSDFSRGKKASVDRVYEGIPGKENMTKEQKDTLFGNIALMYLNVSMNTLFPLNDSVNKIPADRRSDVINHVTPLLKGITHGFDIGFILEGIAAIPADQRADVINHATPPLEGITDGQKIAETLQALFFVSPDDREACSSKIKTEIEGGRIGADPGSITRYVMQDEKTRTNSLMHLETLLTSIEEDPQQANALAQMVLDLSDELGLQDEHPLKQLAIDTLTVSATTTEPNNPFIVFKEHKELATQELVFTPPAYEIEGQKVTFNLETFREEAITEISRENLPVINSGALSQLANDFEKRLDLLNDEKREEVLASFLVQAGFSFDALKSSCFESSELQILLSSVGEKVGLVQAKFLVIMDFVQSQDTSLEEGELFTPQENALMQMGAMIYSCPAGKKEGISQYYNKLLPVDKRLSALSIGEKSPEMTTVMQLVASVVEEQLAERFSGSGHVIQELTGAASVNEPPHQALYLKNRIGQFVGLSHSLTFDRHTGVLYDSLRGKSREEILAVFYKHFTPEVLVESLGQKINADIASGKYSPLTFNTINSLLPGGTNIEKVWTLNDDYEYTAIKPYGALALLKLTKYLK